MESNLIESYKHEYRMINSKIELRVVEQSDLDIFFQHQQDPNSQQMAAFISKDPSSRPSFDNHWNKIMNNDDIMIRTILYDGAIVGHIAKFIMFDQAELTYWIDRNYWGRGIATNSLKAFLSEMQIRPIYARAAKDNLASIRVLVKCGFVLTGNERGFANARGEEIDEVVMQLDQ